jgi:ribose transport system substrate-binding protein
MVESCMARVNERKNMKLRKLVAIATATLLAATLAACGSSSDSASESSAAANKVTKIAFFGFWKTNSFTQAVLAGVEETAAAQGIEVVDLSPTEYDGAAQIKAMQDQTVKGDAQVYITLAIDPVGLATAAEEAMGAGIKVVAAFTPLGPLFDTLEPQVPGLIVAGETPISNGEVLGKLAAKACADKNPCNVVYLEGFKTLPLDNARTKAFGEALAAAAPNAKIIASLEAGYSPETGKKAAQDALQANPAIDVMVGSSQAILGAQDVVDTTKVMLIGNGSSKEAYAAVNSGAWFGLYNGDIKGIGKKSVELGIAAANGETVNPVFDTSTLLDPMGTKDVVAGLVGDYSDLG